MAYQKKGGGADGLISIELAVLSSKKNEAGDNETRVRCVDWNKGDKHYRQLEKRDFFIDQATGEWKNGKAKGMNSGDLMMVIANLGVIADALQIPRKTLGDAVMDGYEKLMDGGAGAPAAAPAKAAAPAAAPAKPENDDF